MKTTWILDSRVQRVSVPAKMYKKIAQIPFDFQRILLIISSLLARGCSWPR
jgi:hypothetical protein